MTQMLGRLPCQIAACLKSRADLRLKRLTLRHQIEALRRSAPKRVRPANADRIIFTWLYRTWPRVAQSIHIVHPKTLVRWHRQGFGIYWRWRSRPRGHAISCR